MKIKELIVPLFLALSTMWIINYYFFGGKKATDNGSVEVRSGQKFEAPKTKQELKPLNKEVDFIDEKRLHKRVETEFETKLAKFVFSNDGASLDRLEFKGKALGTIFPVSDTERENRCFLVALNENTPYYYKLIGKEETDLAFNILYRYESSASDLIIDKKFTVYKNTHKVDLNVAITPKKDLLEGLNARIFFPSPVMPEFEGEDTISGVKVNEKGVVKSTKKGSLDDYSGWIKPSLFGSDSKYFVHAMVGDSGRFVQRAYYKSIGKNMLFSILEGPSINNKSSWALSFYLGPKEEQAMLTVDKRLEQTLAYYGWLSPISKFLLFILKFLYKYLKNYGLAIIVLTILIRLILLPFTLKAEKGMKQRKEFQKKLEYLQRKYKHDKAALSREKAELIKREGMPGLGGCLPMLFQFPLFFALSSVLRSSIELYKAPFVFWITDLSAKDPYYVLPILLSLTMLAQAFTVDPKQRFMMIAMALVLGPLFASFSAGLALYILFSVGLGVLQTVLLKKKESSGALIG